MEERRSSFFSELAKLVLISFLIIVPLRLFIVQPFFVRGARMEPAFEDGEYLLVDEISLRFRQIERGEVVVFRFPPEPTQFYIKRIIGLPGDRVVISNGKVQIFMAAHPNGLSIEEPYLAEGTQTGGDLSLSLGENEYFVLGDNRTASSDSRRWGKLDGRLITGRVWLRAWPPERAQAFAVPQY
ncbi:signal peptidase I [Candidatus Azambacteria bacterium]|nr:signal peptidase I [Candidatus Azambacteria bacterium]